MSVDRVASLHKPFFYKQHATPRLTRTFCIFLTLFCATVAGLPFTGVGRYMYNKSSRSYCQFDWFSEDIAGTVYIFTIGTCGALLTSIMTVSNIFVFIIVVRIKRRMSAVLPSGTNTRRHVRRVTFRQEERMAKFVALVSAIFLVTWLPVTVRNMHAFSHHCCNIVVTMYLEPQFSIDYRRELTAVQLRRINWC